MEPYCTEVAAKPPYSASSAHGTTLADYPVWEEVELQKEQEEEMELQKEQEEVVGTLVEEDSE